MPADGGLRELEDVAQLDDAEFMAFEQAQKPQARGVGQGCHAPEQRGGLCGIFNHLFIRMDC